MFLETQIQFVWEDKRLATFRYFQIAPQKKFSLIVSKCLEHRQ